jgi:purine-binding chemotaxis protein CheW
MNINNTPGTQDQAPAPIPPAQAANDDTTATGLIVSLQVGGQLCGLPVKAVRDVLGPQTITRVPLASPEIAGNLNLRGRIVTTQRHRPSHVRRHRAWAGTLRPAGR